MDEYISRESVEKYIEAGLNNPDKAKAFGHDAIEILAEVHYMPAAEVAPVRHGRWIWNEEGEIDWEQFYRCSNCGDKEYWESNFCPNCGAKMDLEDNDG